MYEDFSLRQVLDIEVSQERVENLKKLGDATMLPLARIKNNHYKTVKFTN